MRPPPLLLTWRTGDVCSRQFITSTLSDSTILLYPAYDLRVLRFCEIQRRKRLYIEGGKMHIARGQAAGERWEVSPHSPLPDPFPISGPWFSSLACTFSNKLDIVCLHLL